MKILATGLLIILSFWAGSSWQHYIMQKETLPNTVATYEVAEILSAQSLLKKKIDNPGLDLKNELMRTALIDPDSHMFAYKDKVDWRHVLLAPINIEWPFTKDSVDSKISLIKSNQEIIKSHNKASHAGQ